MHCKANITFSTFSGNHIWWVCTGTLVQSDISRLAYEIYTQAEAWSSTAVGHSEWMVHERTNVCEREREREQRAKALLFFQPCPAQLAIVFLYTRTLREKGGKREHWCNWRQLFFRLFAHRMYEINTLLSAHTQFFMIIVSMRRVTDTLLNLLWWIFS